MKKIIKEVILLICLVNFISTFQLALSAQARTKIIKIDNLNITVKVGDNFTLPSKVKATLSDRKVVYVSVKWTPNKVSTQNVGKFIFKGKVQNYNKDVILTLNVRYWTLDEIKKEKSKIVTVKAYGKSGKPAINNGLLISPDGKVLTHYAAIDYAQKVEVFVGGKKFEVESVLDYDTYKDLAILKLKGAKNLPGVKIGDSSKVKIGDKVVVLSQTTSYSNTIIGEFDEENGLFVITGEPIKKDESGIALFNYKGEVIGLAFVGHYTANPNKSYIFAIPIEKIKLLKQNKNLTVAQVYEKEHIIKTDDYYYEGDIKDGMRHGYGYCKWNNGDEYIGDWKNDTMDGYGEYYSAKGDVYKGEFKNGMFDGKGTCTFANGDKYEGEWKNDKLNGKGTYIWANGDKYEGEWKNGVKEGYGVYTWADGNRYEGEWKNDKMNGTGTMYKATGEEIKGIWKDGELIQKVEDNF